MNKTQVRHSLKREIGKVNKTIDQRILRGMPYRSYSKRHRDLLRQLNSLRGARTLDVFNLF